MDLDTWVHKYPLLLKSGRFSHYIPKHCNEDEAEELKDKLEEFDKMEDLLRPLAEDKEKLWEIRYFGDKNTYNE